MKTPENVHHIGFCFVGCVVEIATAKMLLNVPFPPYGINFLSIVHGAIAFGLLVAGLYGVFCDIQDELKRRREPGCGVRP